MAGSPKVLRWSPFIQAAAQKYKVPPSVVAAVIEHESGGQEGLTSSAGAKGLTQFMPGTARSYHVNTSPGHARSQIFGEAHYLHDLGYSSDPRRALASYAAGPGNVPAGLPYAGAVLGLAKKYSGLGTGPVAASKPPRAAVAAPGVDQGRAQRFAAYSAYASNPHLPGASTDLALSLLNAQRQTAPPRAKAASAPDQTVGAPAAGAKTGDPVLRGTSIGGLHQTAGLPGYPAHDYFAPAGSAAVAPVTGRVFKLSGHDPKAGPVQGAGGPLGWSVYIHGTDGRDYYLTHLGSRTVHVGQRVTQGEKIGTVADYHSYGRPDHIHLGVHG